MHKLSKDSNQSMNVWKNVSVKNYVSCKQGEPFTIGISHHGRYEEWSSDIFLKWRSCHKWNVSSRNDNIPEYTNAIQYKGAHESNATNEKMIELRKEITNLMIAKVTGKRFSSTEELQSQLLNFQLS